MHAVVVGMIQEILGQDWQVALEHLLREGNTVADLLAKEGADDSCRMKVLESPSSAAIPLLADDYRGTLFMRR